MATCSPLGSPASANPDPNSQRREPPAFWREGMGSALALLGCARCERPRAEALVGWRQNHLSTSRNHAPMPTCSSAPPPTTARRGARPRFSSLRGETGNNLIRTREGVLAIAIDNHSLVISRDNGQTWKQTGAWRSGKTDLRPGGSGPCIAGIHAPLVQLADGRLMAMGRFDDVADQERFGFKMPVSYSSDLGETWSYDASEFPVVSNTQRPVLLRLKEGPIVLCSFTDQARDLEGAPRARPSRAPSGDFTGVGPLRRRQLRRRQDLARSPSHHRSAGRNYQQQRFSAQLQRLPRHHPNPRRPHPAHHQQQALRLQPRVDQITAARAEEMNHNRAMKHTLTLLAALLLASVTLHAAEGGKPNSVVIHSGEVPIR